MENYIQHTIPHYTWNRLWPWSLTEDQKLYIQHREQEMREQEERMKAMLDIGSVFADAQQQGALK